MGTVAATIVVGSVPMFLVAALAPRIVADLGIGTGAIGVIVAAFFLAAAVGSIPGGRLADRLGAVRSLRLGALLVVVGGLAAGVLGRDTPTLVASMVVAGAALALLDPGGARTLTDAVPAGKLGSAFGVKEASIPAASMLAGATLPLMPESYGWRPAFLIAAGAAALVGLSVPKDLSVVSRHAEGSGVIEPRSSSRPDRGPDGRGAIEVNGSAVADSAAAIGGPPDVGSENSTHTDTSSNAGDRSARGPSGARSLPPLPESTLYIEHSHGAQSGRARPADGKTRPADATATASLVRLASTAALGGATAAGVSTYLVTSAVAVGFPTAAAGMLLTVASSAAVIVRLVVGRAADGGPAVRALHVLSWALLVGAGGLALMAIGAAATNDAIFAAGSVVALAGGWGWTGLVFLAAVRLDPQRPAAASGIVLAGLAVGGVAGPIVVGFGVERIGFPPVFLLAAVTMLCSTLLAAITAARHHRPC